MRAYGLRRQDMSKKRRSWCYCCGGAGRMSAPSNQRWLRTAKRRGRQVAKAEVRDDVLS